MNLFKCTWYVKHKISNWKLSQMIINLEKKWHAFQISSFRAMRITIFHVLQFTHEIRIFRVHYFSDFRWSCFILNMAYELVSTEAMDWIFYHLLGTHASADHDERALIKLLKLKESKIFFSMTVYYYKRQISLMHAQMFPSKFHRQFSFPFET